MLNNLDELQNNKENVELNLSGYFHNLEFKTKFIKMTKILQSS